MLATFILVVIAYVFAVANLVSSGISKPQVTFAYGIGHIVCMVAATLICCIHSYEACVIFSSITLGISGGFLIAIFIWDKKGEFYCERFAIRLWTWIFVSLDLICAAISFLCIYYFLWIGIFSLIALLVGAILFFFVNKKYEKLIPILNAFFCASCFVFAVIGFSMFGVFKRGITANVFCTVYEYDAENAEIGNVVPDELSAGEYYAVQFCFEWNNIRSLANKSRDITICADFPDTSLFEVASYLSDGLAFTRDEEDGSQWDVHFKASFQMDRSLVSGYFIVRYSANSEITKNIDLPFTINLIDDSKGGLIQSDEFRYTIIWEE